MQTVNHIGGHWNYIHVLITFFGTYAVQRKLTNIVNSWPKPPADASWLKRALYSTALALVSEGPVTNPNSVPTQPTGPNTNTQS